MEGYKVSISPTFSVLLFAHENVFTAFVCLKFCICNLVLDFTNILGAAFGMVVFKAVFYIPTGCVCILMAKEKLAKKLLI